MKSIHNTWYALIFLSILLGLSILLEGCEDRCEVTTEYTYFEPVYQTTTSVRAAVAQESPQVIQNLGKIYFKGGYLFVNETGKGIHVIDNRNPSAPVNISFINIPGNTDLAIKDNILYADSYIDLLLFDINDINNIVISKRLEGVFFNAYQYYYGVTDETLLITDWKEKTDVQLNVTDCDAAAMDRGGWFMMEDGLAFANNGSFSSPASTPGYKGSGPGVGGSMAKFTISKDHLYMLDGGAILPADITDEANPVLKEKVTLAWDIETIFPHADNLFIGSRTGMHIMDITAPSAPIKISTYEHVRVCDPVVVRDDLAFVTLRSGTECEGFTNQLEVIDISDMTNPQLLHTYPMTNPHGLGVDTNTLFICDGQDGLKVFDASDVSKIDQKLLYHYEGIHAFDVIPYSNVLMMIGADGIYQYDYSDPEHVTLLSQITVEHDN